jgi:peptide/nickel transport system substrate-binding protein
MPITRRAALAASAAAAFAAPARADRVPGRLLFGLSTYPPNLQPWSNAGGAQITIKQQLFRGLLSHDGDGNLRGELAETWRRDGDTGWLFTLRDAVFQNGSPVTSADVAWPSARSPPNTPPPTCAPSSRACSASTRRTRAPCASS